VAVFEALGKRRKGTIIEDSESGMMNCPNHYRK
jgi:hypothetical protein